MRRLSPAYSLIEVTFVLAILATLGGMAVPQVLSSLDDFRTAGAARYMSSRIHQTRMAAIARSRDVALKFVEQGATYTYAEYQDGNGDGVRTRDINSSVDRCTQPPTRLSDQFPKVDFGVLLNLPPVDEGSAPPGTDPIKLGASNLLSFSSHGTSSTGSLYIKGEGGAQYVIRIFGTTGKTRVLKYSRRARAWQPL